MSDLIERPALANFLLDYLEQWEAGNGGCAAMVPKRSQGQFYGGVREGLTEAAQAITALTGQLSDAGCLDSRSGRNSKVANVAVRRR